MEGHWNVDGSCLRWRLRIFLFGLIDVYMGWWTGYISHLSTRSLYRQANASPHPDSPPHSSPWKHLLRERRAGGSKSWQPLVPANWGRGRAPALERPRASLAVFPRSSVGEPCRPLCGVFQAMVSCSTSFTKMGPQPWLMRAGWGDEGRRGLEIAGSLTSALP